jgi:hypothetical protein
VGREEWLGLLMICSIALGVVLTGAVVVMSL